MTLTYAEVHEFCARALQFIVEPFMAASDAFFVTITLSEFPDTDNALHIN